MELKYSKNFIFVLSKLELCQLEMLIFIYKLMCQSSLIKWSHFCSVNLSVNELKRLQKYYFSTIIISNSEIEILVSFSRSTNINVNMYFPYSNFEETLVLMCLASHFDIIETWKVNVGHHIIYYAKKY